MAVSKRPIPFSFVLDELIDLEPVVKPMFGCFGVYVGENIVLMLRQRADWIQDNGVWVGTKKEHHESLRQVLRGMRSIEVFGPGESGWQVLPVHDENFEKMVSDVCELIRSNDPRVGNIPKKRKKKSKA